MTPKLSTLQRRVKEMFSEAAILTIGALRFHNMSKDGNVHIQYSEIIIKKRMQLSINHKLKAPYE